MPSRVGRSPQHHAVSHGSAPFRHELVSDEGRDHRHIVNDGGGAGGGYSRHEGRDDGRSDEGRQREDELSFMAPCWRLLEMAKSFLDQVREFRPRVQCRQADGDVLDGVHGGMGARSGKLA